jgi:hypothetical protein
MVFNATFNNISVIPWQQISSLVGFGFMVINTTFINILVISWQSGLLMEETGVPGENDRHVASH